jgi:Fe-S cluster biogenesis protein NfuA
VSIDLSPVRDLLQLDGGDVELVSEDAGTVHLKLLLESAECAECVLPKPMLEDVASKLLGVSVVLDDPREA